MWFKIQMIIKFIEYIQHLKNLHLVVWVCIIIMSSFTLLILSYLCHVCECGKPCSIKQASSSTPITCILLVFLCWPIGFFVYLPCVSKAVQHVAVCKSYHYSFQTYLCLHIGSFIVNMLIYTCGYILPCVVKKSKIDYEEHPRLHLLTDSWCNKSVTGTPLTLCEYFNNTLTFDSPQSPSVWCIPNQIGPCNLNTSPY